MKTFFLAITLLKTSKWSSLNVLTGPRICGFAIVEVKKLAIVRVGSLAGTVGFFGFPPFFLDGPDVSLACGRGKSRPHMRGIDDEGADTEEAEVEVVAFDGSEVETASIGGGWCETRVGLGGVTVRSRWACFGDGDQSENGRSESSSSSLLALGRKGESSAEWGREARPARATLGNPPAKPGLLRLRLRATRIPGARISFLAF